MDRRSNARGDFVHGLPAENDNGAGAVVGYISPHPSPYSPDERSDGTDARARRTRPRGKPRPCGRAAARHPGPSPSDPAALPQGARPRQRLPGLRRGPRSGADAGTDPADLRPAPGARSGTGSWWWRPNGGRWRRACGCSTPTGANSSAAGTGCGSRGCTCGGEGPRRKGGFRWWSAATGCGCACRGRVGAARGTPAWKWGRWGFRWGPPFVDPAAVDGRGRVRARAAGAGRGGWGQRGRGGFTGRAGRRGRGRGATAGGDPGLGGQSACGGLRRRLEPCRGGPLRADDRCRVGLPARHQRAVRVRACRA